MKNIFLSIIALFILAGCASTRVEEKIVTEQKLIFVKIPSTLLTKCTATAPIDKSRYIQLNAENKEKELTELIIKLYGDIEKCNGKIIGIKELEDRIMKENAGKL